MKILVLGGKGMAGHVIVKYLKDQRKSDQILYTSRDPLDIEGFYLDVLSQSELETLIDKTEPDLVINAIGVLNNDAEKNEQKAFKINALLPHQLVKLMNRRRGKVIHISTDCVFSGKKGSYTESDAPDGDSVYARTKAIGEITQAPHLTIRTSIIGPELKADGIGLFLWFMSQKGEIPGYQKVFWNGVTTLELARVINQLIDEQVEGLIHLHSKNTISKYELLKLMKEIFEKKDVSIIPSNPFFLDRTILNTREDFRYTGPSYWEMLIELKKWMNNSG
ncbi:sugar nucleotide-binding protein [Bacillus hwajinpoensis]|uniref:dTDP-4-dehydrorhamnose reductase n=1 Tax=Guptibacillus hwajinpoensis TaxID=208199 RepID=A0A845EYF6_9BACL|nr:MULTISPECIES: SDR family oxidoreductase [Bacillaceae]MYL63559.1 sugar nucleotide-binding protein [Pseudalkalibacillus hwajinpoensis]PFG12740.1 dTDP-4-dehydrorhamnose reductase [Bacillus sp. es.036]